MLVILRRAEKDSFVGTLFDFVVRIRYIGSIRLNRGTNDYEVSRTDLDEQQLRCQATFNSGCLVTSNN
jgi:hypothetical protein